MLKEEVKAKTNQSSEAQTLVEGMCCEMEKLKSQLEESKSQYENQNKEMAEMRKEISKRVREAEILRRLLEASDPGSLSTLERSFLEGLAAGKPASATNNSTGPTSKSTSVTPKPLEPFPTTAPSKKQSRPRTRFQQTKLAFENASSPRASAQLIRNTQLKLDSNGHATAGISQTKSPTTDSRETNKLSKRQPSLSWKAKEQSIQDQKTRRNQNEAMRKRIDKELEERLKDGRHSQTRKTTNTIQNSTNSPPAHHALRRAFPDGWQGLHTSGVDLECGLHAIILSVQHQRPDISTPTLQDLRDISQREAVVLASLTVDMDNSNNFTADQLGIILYK